MKKYIGILIIITLLLCVGLSGCEVIEENDYITVNVLVDATVDIIGKDGNSIKSQINVSGLPIRIEIVKAGGERLVFERVANVYGYADTVSGTFHLYKEQMIEVTASAQGGIGDFYQLHIGYEVLAWETVHGSVDFGETYTWEAEPIIEMANTTTY
jgi:hypothetical protein